MKTVITKDIEKKISKMKDEGKSIEEISKILGLNSSSVRSHCYNQLSEKDWKEAKDSVPGMKRYQFCPTNGFNSKKLEYVMDTLKRNINKFPALTIIGYQHYKKPVRLMKRKKKHIIGIDCRKKVFNRSKGIEPIVANALDLKEFTKTLNRIKYNYPNCAIYYNLTGRKELLKEIHKRFSIVASVVSSRPGYGQRVSSLDCARELGAKLHHLKGTMWLAISE